MSDERWEAREVGEQNEGLLMGPVSDRIEIHTNDDDPDKLLIVMKYGQTVLAICPMPLSAVPAFAEQLLKNSAESMQ